MFVCEIQKICSRALSFALPYTQARGKYFTTEACGEKFSKEETSERWDQIYGVFKN